MKRKQTYRAPLIKTKEQIQAENKEHRLRSLIDAALERWEPDELLKMFLDRVTVSEAIQDRMLHEIDDDELKARAKKLYDIDEIKEMLQYESGAPGGSLILSHLNLAQEMELEEFIQARIFPMYNQQQNMLFC
jgi:phage baseplate assembly protein W